MTRIALNARFYAHRPTGMQRYALEMVKHFGGQMESVRPSRPLRGTTGHIWEQLFLPTVARGKLLFSPNNTGPLAVSRQVCTFHDLIALDRPEWFNPRFAAWYGWLLPKLARKVMHIIAVSEFTKRRIIERTGIEPRKITVIPNGVDERFTRRSPEEVAEVRQALGITSRDYLLCVGSLEPRKNLRRLFHAWAQIQGRLPDDNIQLVVAGAKGRSLVFSDLSLEQLPPRVHLTGYVTDEQLICLYSGALALVYPSLYEGFGLPPLEAMACGTPVITSNVTSLPEVVGDAAVLIDPMDVDSLADGMERVIESSSLREELRRKGLKRVSQITWKNTAERTWEVLRSHC